MNKLGCGGVIIIAVIILIIIGNINSCGDKETDNDNKEQQETVEQQEQKEVLKDPMTLISGDKYKAEGYSVIVKNEGETIITTGSAITETEDGEVGISEENFTFEGLENTPLKKVVPSSPTYNYKRDEEGNEPAWVCSLDFSLDYDYKKASTEPFDLIVAFTPKGADKPSAKWTLNITLDPEKKKEEEEQAKRESQGIMLEESRPSAMAQAASLFPYPETVNWTDIFFDYQRVMDDGCYEGGTVKYKNAYGNTVKSAYKIKWDYDGNLNWLELDGVLVYSDE